MEEVKIFKKAMRNLKQKVQTLLDGKENTRDGMSKEMVQKAMRIGASASREDIGLALLQILDGVEKEKVLCDSYSKVVADTKDLKSFLFSIDQVIGNFQDNGATSFLDLPSLVWFLAYVHIYEDVPMNVILHIFGMDVEAGVRFFLKSDKHSTRDKHFVVILSAYFNSDGTLRYNEIEEYFINCIKGICRNVCYVELFDSYLETPVDIHVLENGFLELLRANNKAIEEKNSDSSFLTVKKALLSFINTNIVDPQIRRALINFSVSFDHEKCVDAIPFFYALNMFQVIFDGKNVQAEDISTCFGAVVYRNFLALSESGNVDIKATEQLINYYNKDGSFKENQDVKGFHTIIKRLLGMSITQENDVKIIIEAAGGVYKRIDDALRDLLIESNAHYKKERNEQMLREKEALREYVLNYYQDGKMVLLPEDVEIFKISVVQSLLPEDEKQRILNELDLKLKRAKDVIAQALFGRNLEIYSTVMDILPTLPSYREDVVLAKRAIEQLMFLVEYQAMASEEEIAMVEQEISDVISKLEAFALEYANISGGLDGENPAALQRGKKRK